MNFFIKKIEKKKGGQKKKKKHRDKVLKKINTWGESCTSKEF